uniref:Uncharacterized protein n=1 Tax=Tanacetum cinerariifolium TaxID=118510 RepID=A0A6L2LD34_TANCI|nr:hypothetical protein [Tanacetum cinerariifolium]
MTHKEVEELIARRVAEEMEAREVARNLEALNENEEEQEGENGGNGGNGNGDNGGNRNRGNGNKGNENHVMLVLFLFDFDYVLVDVAFVLMRLSELNQSTRSVRQMVFISVKALWFRSVIIDVLDRLHGNLTRSVDIDVRAQSDDANQ